MARCLIAAWVVGPRTTWPASATSCSRRAARLTVSPMAVKLRNSSLPMLPIRAGPVLIPIRPGPVGLALGDLLDGRLHAQGRPGRPQGVVGLAGRGVEQDHDGVADELDDRAPVGQQHRHGPAEVLVEHGHHPVGGGPLGERREAAQVGEEHRHLGHLPAQGGLGRVGQQGGGHVGRHVLAEQPVELAVEPGVLQPDGQLAGQGPQQPPVAVGERPLGPAHVQHPGQAVLDRQRQDQPPARPLGLLDRLQRLQRGPARVAAVVDRLLGVAAALLRPAAGRIDPGNTSCSPSTSPTRSASGRSAWPVSSTPRSSSRRSSTITRASAPTATRARRRSICSRSATSAWAACSSTSACLGEVEAVGQVGHHPADRPGAVALGLLHGLDQRLQGGEVLAADLPDGLLEVDAVEQAGPGASQAYCTWAL